MIDLDNYIPLDKMRRTSTHCYYGNQLKIIYCYPNRMGGQSAVFTSFTYSNN